MSERFRFTYEWIYRNPKSGNTQDFVALKDTIELSK